MTTTARRITTAALALLLLAALLALAPPAAAQSNQGAQGYVLYSDSGTTYVHDDFNSYPVGTLTSPNWTMHRVFKSWRPAVHTFTGCTPSQRQGGCKYVESTASQPAGYAGLMSLAGHPMGTDPFEIIARVRAISSASNATSMYLMSNADLPDLSSTEGARAVAARWSVNAFPGNEGGVSGGSWNANPDPDNNNITPWVPFAGTTKIDIDLPDQTWFWMRLARHGGQYHACAARDNSTPTESQGLGHGVWQCQTKAVGDVQIEELNGAAGWGIYTNGSQTRRIDVITAAYGPDCNDGSCAGYSDDYN